MRVHNETLIGRVVFGPASESGLGTRIQPAYAVCSCGFDKTAADRLADEVAALVVNHHLDSRCAAADALLDYREPSRTPRSDRIADLEAELIALRQKEKSESDPKPQSVYTLTRWAIRHKPSGNFIPDSPGKYTQSEPMPNCIPRLFDTRQGAVSSLNRWLEGVWRLSYYRCGEYEWDYDWGPETPPNPRIKSEMEVVEVEIQIRATGGRNQ